MTKIYTITIQRTYTVEADSRDEALENIDPYDYDDEEVIEIDWHEPLNKPKLI